MTIKSKNGLANRLPHATHAEWVAHGYLWQQVRCEVPDCGLPVINYYFPNDPAYHVDPLTYVPHSLVCGDRRRVEAMRHAEDAKRGPARDGKSASAGDR